MRTRMRLSLLTLLALAMNLLQAAPLGTSFSYQGRLNDGGNPAQGIYDFRFAVYDAAEAGTQIGTTLTNSLVTISNGLFTVTLDFGQGVFVGDARWLEIGVCTNASPDGFTTLSPRQALTPTPHAAYAAVAPIADGAVTSAKIADGTVASADLMPDAITSEKIRDGAVLGRDMAANTVGSEQLADTITLGNTAVDGQLDVYRTVAGTPAIELFGGTSRISTYGDDGQEQIRLQGTGWGELSLNNSLPNNARAVHLTANANGGGYLHLNNTNGAARATLEGLNTGGALSLWAEDGSLGLSLSATNAGGNMLLHDSAGTATVQLRGDGGGRVETVGSLTVTKALGGPDQVTLSKQSYGGRLSTLDESGKETLLLGSSSFAGGFLQLYQSDGALTVNLDGDTSGTDGGGSLNLNGSRVGLFGLGAGGGGEIRIGNTNGLSRLKFFGHGSNGAGEINVFDTSGTETIELLGQQTTNLGSRIVMRQSSGRESVILDGEFGTTGEGGAILLNNGAGSTRLRLEGDSNNAGYVAVHGTNGTPNIALDGNAAGKGRVTTDQLHTEGLRIVSASSTLNSGDTLAPTTGYVRISGNGDGIVLNATTAIANGSSVGQILILEGTHSLYSVTVPDGANTLLGADRTLGRADTLMLIWNGSDWLELSYAQN